MTFVDCIIDRYRDDIESNRYKYTVTLIYRYLYFLEYKEKETFDTLEEAQQWILQKRCYNKITINNKDDEYEIINKEEQEKPISAVKTDQDPFLLKKPKKAVIRRKENPHVIQRLYLNQEGVVKSINIPQLKTLCSQVIEDNANCKKRNNKRKRKHK